MSTRRGRVTKRRRRERYPLLKIPVDDLRQANSRLQQLLLHDRQQIAASWKAQRNIKNIFNTGC
jgi:hypothetical protein